ncbi:MAG: polysaccharide pyruvyl transferase family protein [Prevotella sp.]|jgi:hypothetical protein|nr:polysaccharide pyruvyl transferase family protein [Prevotella sp.]MCH3993388.1 polysaccharide pyruvyl transferase family protein [Prevotella sp.]MCI1474424.1 polysaccharide pyruvyl transferase family protein [Prevotella sp.]MCI1549072.1 polysaccharide pyruvyl transferase family protein [Prevotella sp.]
MRIGILTLPLHTNYGGILQAYALQTVLERMGHEVKVLDKPFIPQMLPWWKRPYSYTKRAIKKYVLGERNGIFQERDAYQHQVIERKFTQPFIESHIHRFVISHLTDINPTDFDAIVVGSDQIWRMMYFNGFWSTPLASDAFLGFTEGWNIKRVSYAASFGTENSDIPEEEIEDCKAAISKFNAVSVREESGVKICKDLFDIEAKWVLDPTMLLQASDYINLIGKKETKTSNGVLMSYVLDENPDVAELRSRIAKDKNLKINISNVADNGSDKRCVLPQPPIEHWLQSFIDADYVINDSFHACVFSILFHKQFTVYGNKVRGLERFTSLLSMFGLEDRLVTSSYEYKPLPDIDYTKVDKILNEKRQEAMSFLKSSLK